MTRAPLPVFSNAMANAILAVGWLDGARAATGQGSWDAAVRRKRAGQHHLRLRARWHHGLGRRAGLVNASGARMLCRPQKYDRTPGHPYALIEDPGAIGGRVNVIPGAGLPKDGESVAQRGEGIRVTGRDFA